MKPLVLGTSMDSHTQKLAPGNWTTKFLFDFQAENAFFLSSSNLGLNLLQGFLILVTWISHILISNIQIAKYGQISDIWLFGYLARCAEHGQVGYP